LRRAAICLADGWSPAPRAAAASAARRAMNSCGATPYSSATAYRRRSRSVTLP
jgi:hypothetical protein